VTGLRAELAGYPAGMSQSHDEQADLDPKAVPDETDDPGYPGTVEGTGSARDDEPDLDEPLDPPRT
jgi:hypothetical protein